MLEDRSIEVVCPVGGESIVFERMTGSETLGRPFSFEVDMLSPDGDIPITKALGQPLTVGLSMGELGERYFNGVVARFSQVGWLGSKYRYRAHVRPWLWLLTRTSNSRIFQNKSVLDVIKQIFDEGGFSGNVDAGTYIHPGDFKPHQYLVQYNETDFNFVSRLMEQEGIYYFFKHTADNHTLVLQSGPVDSKQTVPGYEVVPYFAGDPTAGEDLGYEHISGWSVGVQIEPGAVALREFDFTNAGAELASASSVNIPGSQASYEIFQYPGLYIDNDQRNAYAARRLEEEQLAKKLVRGLSNARGLTPGNMFTLSDHPVASQNASYLVTGITYDLESNDYESGGGGGARDFSCVFHAIDASTTYLSPAISPKPRVEGPQTAIVVGQSGDEITTDNYGRVKVQFHWDRQGKLNENSSCFVRVAQIWAGSGWGGMHIPRIGQEVIVDFLEGNPDCPIITGRVYNSNNMPPYTLPDNKTQSGIKSRSSLGGAPSNFNEIRFEDKKGSEELHVQAEKDETKLVKNNQTANINVDRSLTVGGNETVSIGKNRTESVGNNESVSVTANQTLSVGANRTVSVGGNESVSIGANEAVVIAVASTHTVGAARAVTIGAAYQVTVGGIMSETVGAARAEEVAGTKSSKVGGASSETVGTDKTTSAGAGVTVSAGKAIGLSAGTDFNVQAGKNATIEATEQLTITCGQATIVLKKNGDITINGAKVQVTASGDLALKGSKLTGN